MMLSDMGADVVSMRASGQGKRDRSRFRQSRPPHRRDSISSRRRAAPALDLIARPTCCSRVSGRGVMERLGLGPEAALARNPRLVYGRMTGWGQEGPLAQAAGHDINYIAITGALDSFRASNGEAVAPLNLVGDYGGGALFLVVGVLAALVEARAPARARWSTPPCATASPPDLHVPCAAWRWALDRRARATTCSTAARISTAPYQCADGGTISRSAPSSRSSTPNCAASPVSTRPTFRRPERSARDWPAQQDKLAAVFTTKTRDEWAKLLEGTDACAAPVMGLFEAPSHPHLAARGTFVEHAGAAAAGAGAALFAYAVGRSTAAPRPRRSTPSRHARRLAATPARRKPFPVSKHRKVLIMQLKDVATIVTGGGSGLGAATARAMAAKGAKVAVLDVNKENAEKVAAEIKGVALVGDVADENEAKAALAKAEAAHGVAAHPGQLRRHRRRRQDRRQERALPARPVLPRHPRQPDRHLQHASGSLADRLQTQSPIGEERGVVDQHRQRRRLRRPDRPGRLFGLQGRHRRPDAAGRARPRPACCIRVCTIAPGLFLTPLLMGLSRGSAAKASASRCRIRRGSASRRNTPRSRSTSSRTRC